MVRAHQDLQRRVVGQLSVGQLSVGQFSVGQWCRRHGYSFPSRAGGPRALSSKQPQLGADALSHARGVRRSLSWAPSRIRASILLFAASPTRLRCTTRPWTKMRPGKVNAPRCICPPDARAPCHTAMRGHASSSQPRGARLLGSPQGRRPSVTVWAGP